MAYTEKVIPGNMNNLQDDEGRICNGESKIIEINDDGMSGRSSGLRCRLLHTDSEDPL